MRKYLLFAIVSIILLVGVGVYQYFYFNDGRLHVVFCDVGQGDAIFVRTPNHKYILIDGGPDKSVLNCLAGHMGFWEHSLDMVMLTHPHLDHFMGLYYMLERYAVSSFNTERLVNRTGIFGEFQKKVEDKKIPERRVLAGDKYRIGDVTIEVEAPTRELLARASPDGYIGETGELASLIMKISYKDFDLLLTGDAQSLALEQVVTDNHSSIDVLQVPHHGSDTGLSSVVLEKTDPRLAVISVGRGNRYGHPNKEVIEMLREAGVKALRTDQAGDIEIVSDGKMWRVE